jgi:hypothetical protein
MEADPSLGVLGLIALTPRGANLGVVATTLYEGFEPYGGYPQRDSVTIHRLGPNGTYGWVAKLSYAHSGYAYRWVRVYGVIGNSVKILTTVITNFESGDASGCGTEEGQERCSKLSAKYALETQSSASSFYPIILRVSGVKHGRPFFGTYRLVFDKKSLTKLSPLTKLSRRGSSSVPTTADVLITTEPATLRRRSWYLGVIVLCGGVCAVERAAYLSQHRCHRRGRIVLAARRDVSMLG